MAKRFFSIFFRLLRRRSTRLQHFFHQIEFDPRLGLIFGNGKQVEHVEMRLIGSKTVPVLIDKPFIFACVGMSRSNVFGLEMFQLTVDVVAFCHRIRLLVLPIEC